MDTKDYMESGVIEAYVLGLADAAEAAELERLRLLNPELNQAILEFEKMLEATVRAESVEPSRSVKNDIKKKLANEFKHETLPARARVIKMKTYWKNIAAAALVLFIASAVLNYYYFKKYIKADRAYSELLAETRDLQANNKIINSRLDQLQTNIQWMVNPAVQKIELPGVESKSQYSAVVFWNADSKQVYLLPNNLPPAPAGKQYQLWAMVDGKPVDAGLVENCGVLCPMKTTQQAQAFAITLEKTGGSPQPDLTQLYVLGKISS